MSNVQLAFQPGAVGPAAGTNEPCAVVVSAGEHDVGFGFAARKITSWRLLPVG